jgi:hypothetical protein
MGKEAAHTSAGLAGIKIGDRMKMVFWPDGRGYRDDNLWDSSNGKPTKPIVPRHTDFAWTTKTGPGGNFVLWKQISTGKTTRAQWSLSDNGRVLTLHILGAEGPAETLKRVPPLIARP